MSEFRRKLNYVLAALLILIFLFCGILTIREQYIILKYKAFYETKTDQIKNDLNALSQPFNHAFEIMADGGKLDEELKNNISEYIFSIDNTAKSIISYDVPIYDLPYTIQRKHELLIQSCKEFEEGKKGFEAFNNSDDPLDFTEGLVHYSSGIEKLGYSVLKSWK